MTVSTHILDAVAGRPAAGVAVALSAADRDSAGSWLPVETGATDADGRFRFAASTSPGVHRLVFSTGPYFAGLGVTAFYPEVTITFTIDSGSPTHYHVPLLLSPYAYSTYRGS